jgi:hypothetical protein
LNPIYRKREKASGQKVDYQYVAVLAIKSILTFMATAITVGAN